MLVILVKQTIKGKDMVMEFQSDKMDASMKEYEFMTQCIQKEYIFRLMEISMKDNLTEELKKDMAYIRNTISKMLYISIKDNLKEMLLMELELKFMKIVTIKENFYLGISEDQVYLSKKQEKLIMGNESEAYSGEKVHSNMQMVKHLLEHENKVRCMDTEQ